MRELKRGSAGKLQTTAQRGVFATCHQLGFIPYLIPPRYEGGVIPEQHRASEWEQRSLLVCVPAPRSPTSVTLRDFPTLSRALPPRGKTGKKHTPFMSSQNSNTHKQQVTAHIYSCSVMGIPVITVCYSSAGG